MTRIVSRLGGVTMYRLMLFFMGGLLGSAMLLSGAGVLSYSAAAIALQTLFLAVLCWGVNKLLARGVNTAPNTESALITGLILSAMAGPMALPQHWLALAVMAVTAMASKHVLVFRRRHIFNPAAVGALAAALLLGQPASWWIGAGALVPIVLIGGALVVQKIRRWHLVVSFLGVYCGLVALEQLLVQGRALPGAGASLYAVLTASPILFFSLVMLVEPLTAPRTAARRVVFGVLVAVVFFALPRLSPEIPYSLELSLLIGNAAAAVMSPGWRQRFVLSRKELGASFGSFWFTPARPFAFAPGQFLEYTIAHAGPDARGVRRFFTIASSPTEREILLTTRLAERGSTFKKALRSLSQQDAVVAADVAGDFVLPQDQQQKLAWLAGGIGVTPFRSMAKYLLDAQQARDVVLLYAAREEKDVAFRDLFEEARARFGLRTVYLLSEAGQLPPGSEWRLGRITEEMIRAEIPDYAERLFYLSGPEAMVRSIAKLLLGMGVPRRRIKRDYFPGYGV